MELLLFQFGLLFLLDPDEVVDEVQVVSGGDVVELLGCLLELLVQLSDRVVDVHDDLGHQVSSGSLVLALDVEGALGELDSEGELLGHLVEGLVGPVSEPVDDAAVEDGRRAACSVGEVRVGGVHGEDHMEVSLHIFDELLVDFFFSLHDLSSSEAFLAGRDEGDVLVSLEEPGDLSRGQKSVHSLEEGHTEDVRFIEDEGDLFLLATSSLHDVSQVGVEVVERVVPSSLDLEDCQIVHPGDESGQGGLAHTRSSH